MIKMKIDTCIMMGGRYSNLPALSCAFGAGQGRSAEKFASTIPIKAMKELGTKFVYFWGGDPFLNPDTELGFLIQQLQMKNFYVIAESPCVITSSLYGAVDYLIQVADYETIRTHFVVNRREVVVYCGQDDLRKVTERRLCNQRIYLRPRNEAIKNKTLEVIERYPNMGLHLEPLYKKQDIKKNDDKK